MKRIITVLAIIMIHLSVYGQQQIDEPFSYKVGGLVYFYEYNAQAKEKTQTQKIPKEGLKFRIVRTEIDSENDNSVFYIVKFLTITDDVIIEANVELNLKGNSLFINSEDNNKYYWMRKDQLDKLIEDRFVTISYQTPNTRLTYGASLSLPFKYRPKTNDQNIKITPDITLGGYLGAKFRISDTQPFYLSVPVVTLGMTTLAINDNNNPSNPDKGDGLVLGITTSTGLVFQFDDFQFGLMVGVDRAAGELGRNWIYNDKAWYSFSIGYSFVGRQDKEDEE